MNQRDQNNLFKWENAEDEGLRPSRNSQVQKIPYASKPSAPPMANLGVIPDQSYLPSSSINQSIDTFGLTEYEQQIAWLDAFGLNVGLIELNQGVPAGTVISLRAKPEYRMFVRKCVEVKAAGIVQAAKGDIEGLFNSQIEASVAALIAVRDDPTEKGNNRIKAATEFLDRAPKAPKVRKEIDQQRTIISIPVNEWRNMQQALIEEGSKEDKEIFELLEGVDYNCSELGEGD